MDNKVETTRVDKAQDDQLPKLPQGHPTGIWLSPWMIDRIFAEARAAAGRIANKIDRYEAMSNAQLVAAEEEITALNEKVEERFVAGAPGGMDHEPQVIAYWEWFRGENFKEALEEFSRIVRSIPCDGYERFRAIVLKLPAAKIEHAALSANARRGALGKLAKNPTAAAAAEAKAAAMRLWPEANRRGWTATQFHTELTRRGHAIAPDTARKWLSALRKTGAC